MVLNYNYNKGNNKLLDNIEFIKKNTLFLRILKRKYYILK